MSEPKPSNGVTINFSLPAYKHRLVQKLAGHMADLSVCLNALKGGTLSQMARNPMDSATIRFSYPDVDIESGLEQRQIEKCFRAIVADFISLLDELIAAKRITTEGLLLEPTVASKQQLLDQVSDHIAEYATRVASDRSLTNPAKVAQFQGISNWATECALGLFAIRRAMEHHGGIAGSDIHLTFKALRISVDGRVIDQFPFVTGDSPAPVSANVINRSLSFSKGERVKLTEQDLQDIVLTVQEVLTMEVLQSLLPPLRVP